MRYGKFLAGLGLVTVLVALFNYDTCARLVSGVVAHNHSSSLAGGATLNSVTITNANVTNLISSDATAVDADGEPISITTGAGNGDGAGGELSLNGGPADTGEGGAISLNSGLSTGVGGDGGGINLQAGNSNAATGNGIGGEILIRAGDSSSNAGSGGSIAIGTGTNGDNSSLGDILFSIGGVDAILISSNSSLVSFKPCAAGYTRKTPNLCLKEGNQTNVALVRDVCTTVAAPSTDATTVYLKILAFAQANNGVALRQSLIGIHDTAACNLVTAHGVGAEIREFNATAAGTQLATVIAPVTAPVIGGNFFLLFQDDTGNQGAAMYAIRGYTD